MQLKSTYKVSFLVNGNAKEYFQAELLLFSLEHFAKHAKADILVHCTATVEPKFISYLSDNKYPFKILDSSEENESSIADQLLSFAKESNTEGGVFFLENNMFALEPLEVQASNSFNATINRTEKISFQEIEALYTASQLNSNATIDQISIIEKGMFYIPFSMIDNIHTTYKKRISWLNENAYIKERPSYDIGLSLALSELSIVPHYLPNNYNFKITSSIEDELLVKDESVVLLNCKNAISGFGVIEDIYFKEKEISRIIKNTNDFIFKNFEFSFLLDFKKTQVQPINYTEKSKRFENFIQEESRKWKRKIKLIIHAGTPKTATTSLQFVLYKERKALLKKGILYPDVLTNGSVPKHQWMVDVLYENDVDSFIKKLQLTFKQVKKSTDTIFLSTEGIYNHWFDYSQESKSYIAVLSKYFDLHCWVCFRKPQTFINSYYKQKIKNPQSENIKCNGRNHSLYKMMHDRWFVKHLDYLGFILEIEALIPKSNITILPYHKNILETYYQKLGVVIKSSTHTSENKGLSDASIEILKIINQFSTSIEQKKKCLELVNELDKTLAQFPQQKTIQIEAEELIDNLSKNIGAILENKYNIILQS